MNTINDLEGQFQEDRFNNFINQLRIELPKIDQSIIEALGHMFADHMHDLPSFNSHVTREIHPKEDSRRIIAIAHNVMQDRNDLEANLSNKSNLPYYTGPVDRPIELFSIRHGLDFSTLIQELTIIEEDKNLPDLIKNRKLMIVSAALNYENPTLFLMNLLEFPTIEFAHRSSDCLIKLLNSKEFNDLFHEDQFFSQDNIDEFMDLLDSYTDIKIIKNSFIILKIIQQKYLRPIPKLSDYTANLIPNYLHVNLLDREHNKKSGAIAAIAEMNLHEIKGIPGAECNLYLALKNLLKQEIYRRHFSSQEGISKIILLIERDFDEFCMSTADDQHLPETKICILLECLYDLLLKVDNYFTIPTKDLWPLIARLIHRNINIKRHTFGLLEIVIQSAHKKIQKNPTDEANILTRDVIKNLEEFMEHGIESLDQVSSLFTSGSEKSKISDTVRYFINSCAGWLNRIFYLPEIKDAALKSGAIGILSSSFLPNQDMYIIKNILLCLGQLLPEKVFLIDEKELPDLNKQIYKKICDCLFHQEEIVVFHAVSALYNLAGKTGLPLKNAIEIFPRLVELTENMHRGIQETTFMTLIALWCPELTQNLDCLDVKKLFDIFKKIENQECIAPRGLAWVIVDAWERKLADTGYKLP